MRHPLVGLNGLKAGLRLPVNAQDLQGPLGLQDRGEAHGEERICKGEVRGKDDRSWIIELINPSTCSTNLGNAYTYRPHLRLHIDVSIHPILPSSGGQCCTASPPYAINPSLSPLGNTVHMTFASWLCPGACHESPTSQVNACRVVFDMQKGCP